MWSFAHAISTVISRLLHVEPYPDRADVLLTLRSTISIFNDLITRKQTWFATIKWVEATTESTKLQQLKSVWVQSNTCAYRHAWLQMLHHRARHQRVRIPLRILESPPSSSCWSGLMHINWKSSPAGHVLQLHPCRAQAQPQRLRWLKTACQAMLTGPFTAQHDVLLLRCSLTVHNKEIRRVQVQLKSLQCFAERDSRVL